MPCLQHVYNFAALRPVPVGASSAGPGPAGLPAAKRQLDCAGVVTTTYAACQALAVRHPAEHADLAAARMQISEDHCWLNLGASGGRETSVEVTTDTPAKRGLPVAPDAWTGWLYTGGHAVLVTPHQALAALVTSINPAVAGGKKGVNSEELQAVQRRLLEVLAEASPSSLYPAALCALADLKEVSSKQVLVPLRGSCSCSMAFVPLALCCPVPLGGGSCCSMSTAGKRLDRGLHTAIYRLPALPPADASDAPAG